jgi:hypothetical protein
MLKVAGGKEKMEKTQKQESTRVWPLLTRTFAQPLTQAIVHSP